MRALRRGGKGHPPSGGGNQTRQINDGLMASDSISVVLNPTAGFIEGSDAPGADALLSTMYGGLEGGSWQNTVLPSNSAVHPDSADSVAYIVETEAAYPAWLNGIYNAGFTSTVNVVPADQPMVEVVPQDPGRCSNNPGLCAMMSAGFPYPSGITPLADSDAAITVVQPEYERTVGAATYRGRIYETWVTGHPSQTASGKWEAYWGGRAVGARDGYKEGHWFDWWWGDAASPNAFEADGIAATHDMGAMATSIPMWSTIVSRADVLRGTINHAIGLEMPLVDIPVQDGYVWPAQRRDGASHIRLPQGSRLRLPHGYTPNPAWNWFTKLLVQGVRDYGVVVCDTVGPQTGPTFRCEPGCAALTPDGSVNVGLVMGTEFPWGDLQRIAQGSDLNFTPTA